MINPTKMNTIKHILSAIFFFALFQLTGQAHDATFSIDGMLPKTPEASKLMSQLDVPTNHSTGALNFQVPLTSIGNGAISVPVSASYQTNGFKVNTISSDLGLGWNIAAGGVLLGR